MMKKLFAVMIGFFLILACVACKPKEIAILKIVSSWRYGYSAYGEKYEREFDFQMGTVKDTVVLDRSRVEKIDQEERERYNFNKPKNVARFSDEEGALLITTIKDLGFDAWEEEYVTDDVVYGAAAKFVTVYFADNTTRTTYMYLKYPENFDEIVSSFESCLGLSLYYQKL